MKPVLRLLPLLLLLVLTRPATADDAGNFVTKLGQDTTGVEHYVRSADRIEIDQVGRAPRTLRRKLTYDLKDGAIDHVAAVVTPPGAATPTQTIDASYEPDSLKLVIQNGSAPASTQRHAVPRGSLLLFGASPWPVYETAIMKLAKSKADTLGTTMYYLGAGGPDHVLFRKLGRDSVEVSNSRNDVYHAAVDRSGHVLGTLSPRDTVKVTSAGGAAITIDYGRPSKRGRPVFGGTLVPYGDVWRTGANAATQFRTSTALDFNGTLVPAGFYTLWTLPTAQGWKLIVNSETGQWGTEHKADKDLFKIDMNVSTLPQVVERFTISVDATPTGGVLNLDWDTTRASVAFTAKP